MNGAAILVTIVFIVLKVTGAVTWSWLLVFSPLLILVALYLVLPVLLALLGAIISFVAAALAGPLRNSRRKAELARLADARKFREIQNSPSYDPYAPTTKTMSEKFFSRSR